MSASRSPSHRYGMNINSQVSAYALGVASTPLVALATVATLRVANAAYESVSGSLRDIRRGKIAPHDSRPRTLNAAAIRYAPTFVAFSLPGGILMWRSKVPWSDEVTSVAYAMDSAARAKQDEFEQRRNADA